MVCASCAVPYRTEIAGERLEGQSFVLLDRVGAGQTRRSVRFPRLAANLVLDAIPLGAGTASATVTVLDAPAGEDLRTCADGNATRTGIGSRTKWLAKGLLADVGIELAVTTGIWTVRGAWTDGSSERPQYYDRNPVMRQDSYEGNDVAPHGSAVRLSYTCPTGKKAYVELLTGMARRSAQATTAGRVAAWFEYSPGGINASFHDEFIFVSNSVDRMERNRVTGFALLMPGDQVECIDYDDSTGGTVDYRASYKITEFDL